MRPSRYRDLDPGLPWMGGGPVPRRLGERQVRAVLASDDPVALALMLAYARSYAGPRGGVVIGAGAAAVLVASGRSRAAAGAVASATLAALGAIETRRRARRWEAAVEARLMLLGGHG